MRINLHAALLVAVTAFVTLGLRAAPFLIFGGKRKTPRFVLYLSGVLPYAIMGMLVVYCLRNVNILTGTHGLPFLPAFLWWDFMYGNETRC